MLFKPLGVRGQNKVVRAIQGVRPGMRGPGVGQSSDYIMSEGRYGTPPIMSPPAGQFPFPLPSGPPPRVGHDGCPIFPSSMKYLSAITASLAAGASETLEFSTPGAFCPMKMFLFGSVDVTDVNVTSIASGLEEQIISSPIPGDMFSVLNDCCPVACLRCLCQPGVPLRVTVQNVDAMAQTVRAVLVGSYLDACPPNGQLAPGMLPDVPGCPRPGSDKLVGFQVTVPMDGGLATASISTPGKFCPRQMFLGITADDADLTVTAITSGLKRQIISGALPGTLFTTSNECCVLQCFDCLCAPGVDLDITFQNTDAAADIVVRGALVGEYVDACP